MKKILLAASILVLAFALLLGTFSSSPLPEPPPLTALLPTASPPAGMAVFRIPTGVTHRSAAFAYRGGSFGDERDFAMTAVLVQHPRGDLMIDTGFGRDIATQIEALPFLFRMATDYEFTRSAADSLDAAGYDRKRLRGILITHAHWDHVSGLADLAGTPVLVPAAERAFIRDGGMVTALARGLENVKYEEYAFDGGEYLGFSKSHDVHGDGSVVIVPAAGHTPGSVIVFLTLPGGKRYAMVGDLVWQREGITEREERAWLLRKLADQDAAGVRRYLLHMAAIAAKFPHIEIVPAHDLRGFASMPVLEAAAAR